MVRRNREARWKRRTWWLVLPAAVFLGLFFLAPILNLVKLSLDTHRAGFVGTGARFEFTVDNYAQLINSSFLGYVRTTFLLSGIAAALSIVTGFPLAYVIARARSKWRRVLLIGLVTTFFLSIVVRLYGISLTVLSLGWLQDLLNAVGLPYQGSTFAQVLVVAGILHFVTPITALTLVGPIQNVDPALEEAAQVLGATRVRSIWMTLRLAGRGVLAGFVLAFAVGASAFVVPLLLGRGFILFVSNLVYSRFSDVANYPGGAAISLVLLAISVISLGIIGRVGRANWENPR